jgi:hypothetical protein
MRLPKLTTDKLVCRLRWMVLVVMLMDAIITLIGQPPSFWKDPGTVNEHDPLVRFFLARGVLAYAIGGLLYICGSLYIASVVPRPFGLAILFYVLLGHFWGATSWMVYGFQFGYVLINLFQVSVAVLITLALGKEIHRA